MFGIKSERCSRSPERCSESNRNTVRDRPDSARYAEFAYSAFQLFFFVIFVIWLLKHILRELFGLYRYVRRLWRGLRREDAAGKSSVTAPQTPT